MTADAREIEWQFDALDLRPVLRWLDKPDAWTAAHGVNVVANGTGATQVDRYFETEDWRFRRAGIHFGSVASAAAEKPRRRSRVSTSHRPMHRDCATGVR